MTHPFDALDAAQYAPGERPEPRAILRDLWNKWQAAKAEYEHAVLAKKHALNHDQRFDGELRRHAAMHAMMRAEDAFAAAYKELME